MIRVAYVCADPGVPIFGRKGCSVHVQEMVRALGNLGAEVELFAVRTEGDPPRDLASLRLWHLARPPAGPRDAREAAALAANQGLRAALRRAGTFDLVYERHALWSFAGMEFARESGTPGVLEVNAPLVEEQALYRGLLDRDRAIAADERAFAAARVLAAVSAEVAAWLARCSAAAERIHVVPNGVDPDRFAEVERRAPAAHETFTVGFVGSLKPWHGVAVLIEAFALLHATDPRTRLLIVGDGSERANLERLAAARGLAGVVRFTGAVEPDFVPSLLAEMDVGAAPYPELEQFYFSPLKVYEYMAAGLPVAASRIGQVAAIVRHEIDGLLCAPGDAGALAEALARLARDPGLAQRLGEAGRAKVRANHTWQAAARRILHLSGLRAEADPGLHAEPAADAPAAPTSLTRLTAT